MIAPTAPSTKPGVQIYLTCGVSVPTTYTSSDFQTNAKEDLDLKARYLGIDQQMAAAEGEGTSVVTTSALRTIFELGTPNLKSVSTSAAQSSVDAYFVAFGDAQSQAWTPTLPDADGGTTRGGKYEGEYESAMGLYLRGATSGTLLGGALYNHALVVASGPVTEATIDRFVASVGATTSLLGSTDAVAHPTDYDTLVAAFAVRRDDPSQATGPYRRLRGALLAAKAATATTTDCKADLTAALAVYFAEWERITYATAIYDLNDAAAKALAQPAQGRAALHSFGEAIGLIQSFRGVAQDRRKITDAQIDDLVAKVVADKPYQLVTQATTRAPQLVDAIQTIAGIYAFAPDDVQRFEKSF